MNIFPRDAKLRKASVSMKRCYSLVRIIELGAGGVAQVIKGLPSKRKALSSTSQYRKKSG
jgi:hypothetical protein